MAELKLTQWGEFINRYSVMVPVRFWQETRKMLQHYLDTEQDWTFAAGELVAGLEALMDDEGQDSLLKFVNIEEEQDAPPDVCPVCGGKNLSVDVEWMQDHFGPDWFEEPWTGWTFWCPDCGEAEAWPELEKLAKIYGRERDNDN
jgi:hypothetical protein